MVVANAMRTAEYRCDNCDAVIQMCEKCGHYIEDHPNFDRDGDEIQCHRGRHCVIKCKMGVLK
jgi:hypothetical protein